jgi:Protein of unknown function (DUF3617)
MRAVTAIFIASIIGSTSAFAAELPSRKAGLWEIKTSSDNAKMPGQTIKQCIDAATDRAMQSGAYMQNACPKRDVQRSGNTITIDSTCTIRGKTTNAHSVITGSFDSAYTMTVTSEGEGAKTTMTMAAKWLGPCTGDQKPGDMIMANGTKINIIDMQKRGQPGTPGAPPAK